jgi:hypothetical protein
VEGFFGVDCGPLSAQVDFVCGLLSAQVDFVWGLVKAEVVITGLRERINSKMCVDFIHIQGEPVLIMFDATAKSTLRLRILPL